MTSHPKQSNSNTDSVPSSNMNYGDPGLRQFAERFSKRMERDALVQKTTDEVRELLQVDRVVLYYFYRHWTGQVTFESFSSKEFSIFGSTGADQCFNEDYAALYLVGRVRAIGDIESEPIHPCHRDFLRSMNVRANLAVAIVNKKGLWGLLIAHHCRDVHPWSDTDIEVMQKAAKMLANAPTIRDT